MLVIRLLIWSVKYEEYWQLIPDYIHYINRYSIQISMLDALWAYDNPESRMFALWFCTSIAHNLHSALCISQDIAAMYNNNASLGCAALGYPCRPKPPLAIWQGARTGKFQSSPAGLGNEEDPMGLSWSCWNAYSLPCAVLPAPSQLKMPWRMEARIVSKKFLSRNSPSPRTLAG